MMDRAQSTEPLTYDQLSADVLSTEADEPMINTWSLKTECAALGTQATRRGARARRDTLKTKVVRRGSGSPFPTLYLKFLQTPRNSLTSYMITQ